MVGRKLMEILTEMKMVHHPGNLRGKNLSSYKIKFFLLAFYYPSNHFFFFFFLFKNRNKINSSEIYFGVLGKKKILILNLSMFPFTRQVYVYFYVLNKP